MDAICHTPIPWSEDVFGLITLRQQNIFILALVIWGAYMLALVAVRQFRAKYFKEDVSSFLMEG